MLATMLALTLASTQASETQTLTATDDLWVYSQATDQNQNTFLRAWGNGESGLAEPDPAMAASWSVVKFELSPKEGMVLKEARLRIHHVAQPGWTTEESKKWPLEVRLVNPAFKSQTWTFGEAKDVTPAATKEALLGSLSPEAPTNEETFAIEIPLSLENASLTEALGKPAIAFAFTSAMDVRESEMKRMYKFYGRAAEEALRPNLILVWDKQEARATGASRSR
ncbi:MAG: hypothetical protein MUC92_08115 [Fimbriimonadaceae bacterium]|jgi:hypothetical protein|nr:hypothetical protein [Fimbriimonadaceae bacterium]